MVALVGDNPGSPSCSGDGTGAACPCSNPGGANQGCANSSGAGGASLTSSGSAFLTVDTFGLQVEGIPGATAGLCVKGSTQLAGGLGLPIGDGLLCLAPELRSQVIQSDATGQLSMTDWRGQPFGSFPDTANLGAPTYYQWWYRDPVSTCTGAGFNFTNAWAVTWFQ